MEILESIHIDTTNNPVADIAAYIISYYDSFITWGEGEYAQINTRCVRCCPLGVLAHAISPAWWERKSLVAMQPCLEALRHVYVDDHKIMGSDFGRGLWHGSDGISIDTLEQFAYDGRITPEYELGYQVGQLVRRWGLTGIEPHEVVLSWSPYE